MGQSERLTSIRGERDRFVAFAFAAADLLVELDADGIIVYASGAAHGFTGVAAHDLPGRRFLDLVVDEDRKSVATALADLAPGTRFGPFSLRLTGSALPAVLGACKLPEQDASCHLTLSTTTLPPIRHAAGGRDDSTGLLQREDFAKLAGEQLDMAERTGQDVKLTLFRLAGIEELRENIGEAATDEFLHEVGALLRAKSLGGDSAGRLDGDRYGVVHSALIPGDDLLDRLGEMVRDVHSNADIDVAGATLDLSGEELGRKDAGQALVYAINTFAAAEGDAFDISSLANGLKGQMADTMGRITRLKQCFADGDFRIVFQPIVDLKSRETHHHEVLTRFAEGGSPFETIRFAEEVGLIRDFDLAVCRKAIDYLKRAGSTGARPQLAINISSRSLENEAFIATLRRDLAADSMFRCDILFEITESSEIVDLAKADSVIQTLRRDGHKVCMDDFGAGAASFPYIRALTLDYVKVDGAYVRQVLTEPRDSAILKAMAGLCADLGVGTVAEMIETEEQAQALIGLGVQLGQGWLFGKPSDEAEPAPVPKSAVPQPRRAAKRGGYAEDLG